jgi:phage/plasmid-associated DNA primase
MVKGCLDYQAAGSLKKPEEIITQTTKYREEQNQIGMFAAECLKEGGKTYAGVLYNAYKEWAENNEYLIKNITKFGRKLKKLYKSKKLGGGIQYKAQLINP